MERLFLLDAYAIIYRAYYAFMKNPRINSKGQNTSAILGFVNTLEEIIAKERPSHLGVAFDPAGGTFRHELYKEYKAQREETPETIRESVPIIKEIIKAYNIPILEVAGFEADDVIGTLAKQADEKGGIETYMLTPDKDYCQLVSNSSFVYRPRYGDSGYEIMTPDKVKEKYEITDTCQIIDLLGLMGDSSDNIPGCPGVGPKTAQKLIAEFGSIENILNNTDKLKGALKNKIEENRENIEFSKLLATIRRDVPVELDMEILKVEKPNLQKIKEIFTELEFRTLINRLADREGTNTEVKTETKTVSPKNDGFSGDLFGEFEAVSTDLFENSNLSDIKSTYHNYYLIDTVEDIKQLSSKISACKFCCFDTETSGLNPITSKLVGISISIKEHEAYYIPVTEEREKAEKLLSAVKTILEDETILKIGHNIKYDILVLSNSGIDVKGEMFDTMIAHYLLQPELHHNMDYLAEIYLKYKTIHIEELIGEKGKHQRSMADLAPEQIYEYACEDADITIQLKNILETELKKDGTYTLFKDIEMPLVKVLAYMEKNGVRLDTASLKETSGVFGGRMKAIEKEIFSLAGIEFNILSPKQVGEVLFDRLRIVEKAKKTKTGQYVTSEEVLEGLRYNHPIVDLILQYRGLKKLLGTYVDALPLLINPQTGKIHTSYNQTVTATGRLSSSNPNLQNIPIRDEDGKEVRKAFIPDEGCTFFSADYSQIELRIMAHLSGDSNMIEDFNKGNDIHAATAAKVFNKPLEDVTKSERSRAKTANFGIIYGISVFGLAERMGVNRTQAKELIENYFKTYSGIKRYMDLSIEKAREKKYIETILNRRRYLPNITSNNAIVRGFAERNAINAPIQGSAADIIKKAMIGIYNRFMKENIKSTMILQVHDELNFNVVKGEEEIVKNIVLEEMQNAYPMSVPLVADYGWGKNWLEAH